MVFLGMQKSYFLSFLLVLFQKSQTKNSPISSCINIFSLEINIEEMFVLTQASERLTSNQKVMGSIPVRDSEVFSSEKKKLVSTQTFLL